MKNIQIKLFYGFDSVDRINQWLKSFQGEILDIKPWENSLLVIYQN